MISIIIPVYNGEKYIARCLDSLLVGDTSRLEVIAVNDGSRDSSSQMLHGYAEKYPCLKVIDKENGGAATARRTGLAEAHGKYIAFLDIDDFVDPNMYKAMLSKAEESGADIVFCNYIEEYPTRSNTVKNVFREGQTFPLCGDDAIRYLHSRRAIFPFPWNKIYRAELLSKVKFPEGNFVGEDYNMLLQLFGMTDKVEYVDIDGYHYVLTENSASRTGYSDATLRAYNHFKEDYEYVCSRYPDMKNDVASYLVTEYMACVIAMGRNKKYNKDMIREIKKFVRKDLSSYIKSADVPFVMKGSALTLCVSYRLLVLIYKIIK